MQGLKWALVVAALSASLTVGTAAEPAAAAETSRASVHTSGAQGEFGNSYAPMVSATGRYVVFESSAYYLTDGVNGGYHVYLRDRETPLTERVSVSSAEVSGNYDSLHGSVSADGRYVVFQSGATNLVTPATTFGRFHVYLRDRQEGTTLLVSAAPGGAEGNQHSQSPVITADGRYVAYRSGASNLTDPPVGTYEQILRWDRLTGETILVSLNAAGGLAGSHCLNPAISDDGDRIVFQTHASLVPLDQTGNQDIYLRDVASGSTWLVSVSWDDTASGNLHSYDPAISGDGSHAVFESQALNLIEDGLGGQGHLYLRNLDAEFTRRISVNAAGELGNGYSMHAGINGDGGAVVFESNASNLIEDDINGYSDIFVYRDGLPPWIERVSVRDESLLGEGEAPDANGWSWYPAIDAGGLVTAFQSWSTDLVADDTNGVADIFVRESDALAVGPLLPNPLALSAWPNPLRRRAGVELSFALPAAATVRAEVFDPAGRLVRVLAVGPRGAGSGTLRWDARDASGRPARAGIYLVRLRAGDQTALRKLVLLP